MKDYKEYIGIPFINGGRSKTGADCWGLVRLILKEQFKIDLPLLPDYKDALDKKEIGDVIEYNKPIISNKQLEVPVEGCIVLMGDVHWASHVGLYIGDKTILHTTKQTGAVLEKINSPRLKNRIKGYYSVD